MENKSVAVIKSAQEKFELACQQAESLQLVNNFGGAFVAANVVRMLREAMNEEVMKVVFMPLMNTKVGFLTDRDGKPNSKGTTLPLYSMDTVRDCIIDAAVLGILPTGNQFNIIAERMYPTKEGYTYLLNKMGVKYVIEKSFPDQQKGFAIVACKISYKYKDEINSFSQKFSIKAGEYASADLIMGKAERKAKKALYEYITGVDLGDSDADSAVVEEGVYEDVTPKRSAACIVGSALKTEADINTALLRGQINKTEADTLRQTIIKRQVAADVVAAAEPTATADGLFSQE